MQHRRIVAATCALGLTIAACGGAADDGAGVAGTAVDRTAATPAETSTPVVPDASPSTSAAPAASSEAAPDPVGSPDVVPALLQFSAPLVGGGEIDATTLADKPTVFWFWAPT